MSTGAILRRGWALTNDRVDCLITHPTCFSTPSLVSIIQGFKHLAWPRWLLKVSLMPPPSEPSFLWTMRTTLESRAVGYFGLWWIFHFPEVGNMPKARFSPGFTELSVLFYQNAESWRETHRPQLAQRHLQHLRRVQLRAPALCAGASLQLTQVTTKTVSALLLTVHADFIYRGPHPLHAGEWVSHEHHCVAMTPVLPVQRRAGKLVWSHGDTATTPDSTQMDADQKSVLFTVLAVMLIIMFVLIVIIFSVIQQEA